MWFKNKPEPRPSFSVGGYTLDMVLIDGYPFCELSPAEYETIGRQFVGERIYNAPEIEFVGKRWNITLGTVHGRLYKIASFLELEDKNEANEASSGALTFCNEHLGKPTEQRTGLFVWDTTDGNVILQTAEAKDWFAVNLFLTSRSVRAFQSLV